MPVEFVLLRKRFFAQITFIWFVSFMNSLMILEVRAFDKCLVAESTLVGFDACHASVMIALTFLVSKDLTAYVALESFWITWQCQYMTTITISDILVFLHCLLADFSILYLIILKRQKHILLVIISYYSLT